MPDGTRTLALIVHDADAPSGDFVHWLAWNIDPADGGIEEDKPAPVEGTAGFGRPGYDLHKAMRERLQRLNGIDGY